MGVVVPVVTHVQNHRDLSLNLLVHGKQPGIVDSKPLGIRVHLDAPQTHIHNPLHLVGQPLHFGMGGAKARKAVVELCLL